MRNMMKAAVLGAATASLALTGVLSAGAAQAADNPAVNIPILSNNLVQVPVNIPVNLCGITLGILGSAPLTSSGMTTCVPTAPAAPPAVAPPAVPPAVTPPVMPAVPPATPEIPGVL